MQTGLFRRENDSHNHSTTARRIKVKIIRENRIVQIEIYRVQCAGTIVESTICLDSHFEIHVKLLIIEIINMLYWIFYQFI